jgi:L-malate glycosyltransferase
VPLSKSYLPKTKLENKFKVLHICSGFANNRIYIQLVKHLAGIGIPQVVYSAVRSEKEAAGSLAALMHTEYNIRYILRPHDRLFFRAKIRKVVQDLRSHVDLSPIGLIHAHFLYSDGAAALQLKKQYNIPYIVAVRNTDINIFRRYRPDLNWLADEVLSEASRVVFISPSYRTKMLARLKANVNRVVDCKAIVVPNGIESSWLTYTPSPDDSFSDLLRLIYVGDFSRNKNIPGILQAVSILSAKQTVQLTLVGGGGSGEREVQQLLNSGKFTFAKYLGRIEDRLTLQAIYRENDLFVMPSFNETFGVVYIESLSQGLPIVYSRGQGVDGYFAPGTVGEEVDPKNPADIADKIKILANRRQQIVQECVMQAQRFNWSHIARTYEEIYASVRFPVK